MIKQQLKMEAKRRQEEVRKAKEMQIIEEKLAAQVVKERMKKEKAEAFRKR